MIDKRWESASNLSLKQIVGQSNDKLTINTDTMQILANVNNTNLQHKFSEEFLQKSKSTKDEKSQKLKEGDKKISHAPNNSDLTDLSSTKSGKLITHSKEVNTKLVKIKAEFEQSIPDKVNIKRINTKKSSKWSINKGYEEIENKKLLISNKVEEIKHDAENQLIINSSEKINKDPKEIEINSIHNKSISESNELFTNELSWIKNGPWTIKKKDNSEIYDQWLNESKNYRFLYLY